GAALHAALRQAGGDDIDFFYELLISKSTLGAVIHQRELVRRALGGSPDEVVGGLHGAQSGSLTWAWLDLRSPARNFFRLSAKYGSATDFITFWISNSVASSIERRQPMWKPSFAIACRWVGPSASWRAMSATFLSQS